jgi:hypothetical protein
MDKNSPQRAWPAENPWELHRREQTLFIAKNTTPAQRLEWLEQMLILLAPYLPKKGPLDRWPNGEVIEKPK